MTSKNVSHGAEHGHPHSECCGHSSCGGHKHSNCGGQERRHKHSHNGCCEHSHGGHKDSHCSHGHSHCGCCGHSHEDNHIIIRLILGAVLFIAAIVTKALVPYYVTAAVFGAAYLILGYDVLFNAVKGVFGGHILNESFLMSTASIGAFLIGEQPEAVLVMLLYQAGEKLQDTAVSKSRRSIAALMDLRPDYVSIEDGKEIKNVSPDNVKTGDIFVVKQGQRIALDGVITDGETYLDTSAITGESVPRYVNTGDEVLSGSINTASTVHVRATKAFSESTASKILDMVENAQDKKARSESFITEFAKYYTPVVCILSVLVMLIPSLITGDTKTWLMRGLTFLVVSCPCALVISIPLSFFAGLGCASKSGVLIKGSNCLEMLARLGTVVFDKTGTLTKGNFTVTKVSSDEALFYAAYAEFYSDHPIASAIKSAFGKSIDASKIGKYTEFAGKGAQAVIDGSQIVAGNMRIMRDMGISVPQIGHGGTIVYLAKDGEYLGYIIISDEIKENAKAAVSYLNGAGIRTAMLTGDKSSSADAVSKEVGIADVSAELLPADKVACLERIMEKSPPKRYTAFAGDGINDAPVLMRADIGIAMGGIGSDSAIEAADVVLMDDDPMGIPNAVRISKRTLSIVKENTAFAIGVKIIIMVLSALGIANMWLAIFGDVGVSIIAVLNSMRAFNVKQSLR